MNTSSKRPGKGWTVWWMIAVLLTPTPVLARSDDPQNFQSLLRSEIGKPAIVVSKSGQTIKGTIDLVSTTEIDIKTVDGRSAISVSDVREVRVSTGRNRSRRVIRGAWIGAAIGGGVSATAIASAAKTNFTSRSNATLAELAIAGMVAVAGIGALTGAVFPDHYSVVYKAR